MQVEEFQRIWTVLLLPSYTMYIVQTKCQVPMEIHSGGRTVFCEGLNLVDVP